MVDKTGPSANGSPPFFTHTQQNHNHGCIAHRKGNPMDNHTAQSTWSHRRPECMSIYWRWMPSLQHIPLSHMVLSHPANVWQYDNLILYKQDGAQSLPLSIEAVNLWNWCIRTTLHYQWHTYLVHRTLWRKISAGTSPQTSSGKYTISSWPKSPPCAEHHLGSCSLPNKQEIQALLLQSSIRSRFQEKCPSVTLDRLSEVCLFSSPLLPQILRKICHDRAKVILISPNWPRQFWFLDLLQMSSSPFMYIQPFQIR